MVNVALDVARVTRLASRRAFVAHITVHLSELEASNYLRPPTGRLILQGRSIALEIAVRLAQLDTQLALLNLTTQRADRGLRTLRTRGPRVLLATTCFADLYLPCGASPRCCAFRAGFHRYENAGPVCAW